MANFETIHISATCWKSSGQSNQHLWIHHDAQITLQLANDMSSSPRKAGCERANHITHIMSTHHGTTYLCQKGDMTHCLWRDSHIFSILFEEFCDDLVGKKPTRTLTAQLGTTDLPSTTGAPGEVFNTSVSPGWSLDTHADWPRILVYAWKSETSWSCRRHRCLKDRETPLHSTVEPSSRPRVKWTRVTRQRWHEIGKCIFVDFLAYYEWHSLGLLRNVQGK